MYNNLIRALESHPAPVIAMIEGTVWGGACEVAFACDLIVASEDAKFSDPVVMMGIGVAGLVEVARAGRVLVANALGSGVLESAGLAGFLPRLCEHLLGEPLAIASVATWWCGEAAALPEALQQMADGVVKPTYPSEGQRQSFEPRLGRQMDQRERDEWAGRILRDSKLPIEYMGFVEGDDISRGTVDVVVTEGFTGNIALKAAEGTAKQLSTYLRQCLQRTLLSKIGAVLAQGAFRALKDRMDPRKHNGGVFLGLNGIVVKSHGGTDSEGFAAAVDLGLDMARNELTAKIMADIATKNLLEPQPTGAAAAGALALLGPGGPRALARVEDRGVRPRPAGARGDRGCLQCRWSILGGG